MLRRHRWPQRGHGRTDFCRAVISSPQRLWMLGRGEQGDVGLWCGTNWIIKFRFIPPPPPSLRANTILMSWVDHDFLASTVPLLQLDSTAAFQGAVGANLEPPRNAPPTLMQGLFVALECVCPHSTRWHLQLTAGLADCVLDHDCIKCQSPPLLFIMLCAFLSVME